MNYYQIVAFAQQLKKENITMILCLLSLLLQPTVSEFNKFEPRLKSAKTGFN